MKIKIIKRKNYLRIEKILKKEFIIRTLIFFLIVLYFFITSFIKYGILTVGMSIFCLPVIFLFYLRFILKCSYEILIVKKDAIRFYISKNPYFKLHFKLKNKEYSDFGLMLDNNNAKEILKEIKNFLKLNYPNISLKI